MSRRAVTSDFEKPAKRRRDGGPILKYSAGGPRSRAVSDIETVLANRVVRRIRNLNLLLRLLRRRATGMPPPPRAARTGRREEESSAQKSPAEICRAIDQTGEQEAIGSNACGGGSGGDGDQKCRLRVPAPHLTPKDTGRRLCRSPPSITVKGNYAHFSLYNVRTRREVSVSVAAPSMRKLNIR